MAKLIAFGDSFTWGSDMADTMRIFEWEAMPDDWKRIWENRFENTYSRSTWQSLLAQHSGMDYMCLAEQGCSNQSILRRFFENVGKIKTGDIVNVNFTWRNRYDFFNTEEQKWQTVRPSGTEGEFYSDMYYKHIQGPLWDQIESLKAINLIVDYLKMNNIKHIVTCIDDSIYNDPSYSTPLTTQLQRTHADAIIWFNETGFHQWSQDNNFEISPLWHPLEQAHKAAFEYMKVKYDKTN